MDDFVAPADDHPGDYYSDFPDETDNSRKNIVEVFPLEKLCLNLIVENFERFCFAFTVTQDEILERNFEFLQRRFSSELATQLFEQSCREGEMIRNEYLTFIVNKHLNFLNGIWLERSLYQNSPENTFRLLPNLTKYRDVQCCDEILRSIAKFCPKMLEIDVSFSRVTDKGIKYLCEDNGRIPCPALKNIFVKHSNVSDKSAECLIRSLPYLEKFDYPNVPLLLHSIHQENLRESKKVQYYNLVELNLNILKLENLVEQNYFDILKSCLTVCPKVKSLACYVTEEEQFSLFTNNHLKNVHFNFKEPYQPLIKRAKRIINIDDFLKMKKGNLTSLKLAYCCTMSISVLGIHCPNLKEFFADSVNLTYDDNKDDLKPNFSSLIECGFYSIDESSLKAISLLLSSSPNLETITLEYCKLSFEIKRQLLLWCRKPCANKIVFKGIFNYKEEREFPDDEMEDMEFPDEEMEFLRDIFTRSSSLKEIWLSDVLVGSSDHRIGQMNSFLRSLPRRRTKIIVF